MTDDEIRRVVDELDDSVSKENADIIFNLEYEEDGCELVGNRNGFVRLAIEMLRAAVIRLQPGESFTPIQIDYLLRDRGMRFKRIVRQEDVAAALPPPRPKMTWNGKIAAVGCLLLLAFFLMCSVIGGSVVARWVFR